MRQRDSADEPAKARGIVPTAWARGWRDIGEPRALVSIQNNSGLLKDGAANPWQTDQAEKGAPKGAPMT
jgi:hypothetical protein